MKKVKIHISEEPHCRELESIGSVFLPLMKDAIGAEDLVEISVILNWQSIVGKDIALYCNPLKTRFNPKDSNRTLYVEVPLGGFALEIQHKKDYLLDKLNAYFGYKAIHKINISQNANMKIKNINTAPVKVKERALLDEEQKYLLSLSETIKDENLREILIKLGKNVILSTRSK